MSKIRTMQEPMFTTFALLAMFRDFERRCTAGNSDNTLAWRGEFLDFVLWMADELADLAKEQQAENQAERAASQAIADQVIENEAALQRSRALTESVTRCDWAKR